MSQRMTSRGDAFISVSDDLDDQKWVDEELGPALQRAGIEFTTSHRLSDDQYLVDALASAIDGSRYTLFVLTPAWNEKGRGEFEKALAQLEDPRGVKHHLIPLWLKDCPIPKTLKIYTKRDLRRPESRKLQTRILIGRLLPPPAEVSQVPRTLSAKLLTWAWEHPRRTGLLALLLLLALAAAAGVPAVEGWQAVSQDHPAGNGKLITRIDQTLFVMSDTGGGCEDTRDTGLSRSTDGGKHWKPVSVPALDIRTGGTCSRSAIIALVPSLEHPGRIYAATESVGMLVSENGGTTWEVLNAEPLRKQLFALAVLARPERLLVVAHDGGGYSLHRSSDDGRNWERLDTPGVCKQGKSLPTAAADHAHLLVAGDLVFIAPGDSLDQNSAPAENDVYYSADGGECWRPVYGAWADFNYSELAALPDTRSEILIAKWNRKGLARELTRRNLETGQEISLATLPLAVSQVFVDPDGETWYASTPLGLLFRGSAHNPTSPERLPGPFSLYAAFTDDFDGGPPLLLSGGRVFRRGSVGWWQGLVP